MRKAHLHVGDTQEVLALLRAGDVVKHILHSQGHNAWLASSAPHGVRLAAARLAVSKDRSVEASHDFRYKLLGRVLVDSLCAPRAVEDVVQGVHTLRHILASRLYGVPFDLP